jgi:monothiol glutaredoxin
MIASRLSAVIPRKADIARISLYQTYDASSRSLAQEGCLKFLSNTRTINIFPASALSIPLRAYSTTNQSFKSASDDSGSHSDFAPKRKVEVSDEEQALKMIADQVQKYPVMLYMKGNPSMPMCGFSSRVVKILKDEGIDFSSVNVLDYPAIREGIKKFSDWPTIPQLYVKGEFLGGCDIITSMHESGELAEALKEIPKDN